LIPPGSILNVIGFVPRHDIWTVCLTIVMPALVAGIHVFTARQQKRRGWQRKSGLPDFRIITVPQVG